MVFAQITPTTGLYRVFIKYCVIPYNFLNFLNSAHSAAALVFYLPGVCTHTDIEKKTESGIYIKIFEKNTIFNEHPVCHTWVKTSGPYL